MVVVLLLPHSHQMHLLHLLHLLLLLLLCLHGSSLSWRTFRALPFMLLLLQVLLLPSLHVLLVCLHCLLPHHLLLPLIHLLHLRRVHARRWRRTSRLYPTRRLRRHLL